MIASFTTIHVNAINQIPKAILYGFPVAHNPIFTHISAQITEYIIMSGLLNELNCKTKIQKIVKSEINNHCIAAPIRSAFSCCSPATS